MPNEHIIRCFFASYYWLIHNYHCLSISQLCPVQAMLPPARCCVITPGHISSFHSSSLTHLLSISMALPAQSIFSPTRDTKYNLSCVVSLVQQGVFKCQLQCCLCLYCILLHGPIIFYWVAISHALNPVINRLTFWLRLLSGCYRLCYYLHYCSVALWIHIYWYSKLQVKFFFKLHKDCTCADILVLQ